MEEGSTFLFYLLFEILPGQGDRKGNIIGISQTECANVLLTYDFVILLSHWDSMFCLMNGAVSKSRTWTSDIVTNQRYSGDKSKR